MDYDTDGADISIWLDGSVFTANDGQALATLERHLQPHFQVECSIALYSPDVGVLHPAEVGCLIRDVVLPLAPIWINLISQALYDTIKARFLGARTSDIYVTVEVAVVDAEDMLFTRRVQVRTDSLGVDDREAVDAIAQVVKEANGALQPSED